MFLTFNDFYVIDRIVWLLFKSYIFQTHQPLHLSHSQKPSTSRTDIKYDN